MYYVSISNCCARIGINLTSKCQLIMDIYLTVALVVFPFFLSGVYLLSAYLTWLRELRRARRVITWAEVTALPSFLEGTVIINRSNQFGLMWWTEQAIDDTQANLLVLTSALLIRKPKFHTRSALQKEYPTLRVVEILSCPWVKKIGADRKTKGSGVFSPVDD